MFTNEGMNKCRTRISQVPRSHPALGQVRSLRHGGPWENEYNSPHCTELHHNWFLFPVDHKRHEAGGCVRLIHPKLQQHLQRHGRDSRDGKETPIFNFDFLQLLLLTKQNRALWEVSHSLPLHCPSACFLVRTKNCWKWGGALSLCWKITWSCKQEPHRSPTNRASKENANPPRAGG